VTQRKNQPKTNGHAGPHDRSNGYAPASMERGGVPLHRDRAASDDANGCSVASAAITAVAGADREACAEVAPPRSNGELHAAASNPRNHNDDLEKIPGGEFPLPANPGEFVEEIHRNADLFIVWESLLNSKDDKVRQRAVEKLTEMRYKGAAALTDEPRRIIIDMPEPNRD
jgi:hypothetical protein